MLAVESALHLRLKVRTERLTVNGLVDALERLAPTLEGQVVREVLDRAQRDHLEAVRAGRAPPVTCGLRSGPSGAMPLVRTRLPSVLQ